MDTIIIENMEARTIIGTLPRERRIKQRVILTVELSGNFRKAAETDDYHDTFDYSAVEHVILEAVENSSFNLIEALSAHVAKTALNFKGVEHVKVRLSKPGAPKYASNITIVTERP